MSDHRKQTGKHASQTGLAVLLLLLVIAAMGALIYAAKRGVGKVESVSETVPETGTRYSATEAETGEQKILVYREPEETEAPPKYTENDNTKLLVKEEGSKDITVSFAGDILFDSHYAVMASMLSRSGGNPKAEDGFDEEILSLMRSADVFMVNNEFPYSNRGEPREGKKYTFRADPSYVRLLSEMGADIVALANNHLYDYGEEAFLDTLDILDEAGIPHVGAGRNLAEASAPFCFTNGQVKVGIVSATQIERLSNPDTKGATETEAGVFRCLNPGNLTQTITAMKEECDFVIAYLHWGTESTDVVDEHQKKLEKAVKEAGADLIIGDHPHVLQGIGLDGSVPVVYSLGNFLFNSSALDTCLVTAVIDGEQGTLKSLRFIPARQENCRTKLLEGEEKERVLAYMATVSEVTFDEDGFVNLSAGE